MKGGEEDWDCFSLYPFPSTFHIKKPHLHTVIVKIDYRPNAAGIKMRVLGSLFCDGLC